MTQTLNAAAVTLAKHFEGCARRLPDGRIAAYPDPATGGAPWTIGWGTTGSDVVPGLIWTQAQCDARFQRDSAVFAAIAALLIGSAPTTANQFGAIVCLAYNIGLGNLGKSSVLRFHRAGAFHDAAQAFGAWNKANGRVMSGLVRRRAAEALLYDTPDGREDVAAIIAKAEGKP